MINNLSQPNNNLKKQHEFWIFNRLMQNSNSKTALAPKGRLVHENLLQKTASAVVDTGKDVVNLGKALTNGNSDDHSLGRMNDLGKKLGALGIATYLFTKKIPTKSKLMEFIGGTTFFASMALWPKIFIAAPIKARFGFDIHQKYIDSQGRKKDLFQDNGYIPKLETKEELSKLADKLNIPKNMEYREEYAVEKRRRIALQARTLDMLTAGFATPLLTALTCNRIEKIIDKPVIKMGVQKAKKITKNFSDNVDKKAKNPLFDTEGAKIIKSFDNYDGPINDEMFNSAARAFAPNRIIENPKLTKQMPDIQDRLSKDLKSLFAASIDEKQAAEDLFELILKDSVDNGDTVKIPAFDPFVVVADGKEAISEVQIQKADLKNAVQDVMAKVKKGEVEYSKDGILNALCENKALNIIQEATIEDSMFEAIDTIEQYKQGRMLKNLSDIRPSSRKLYFYGWNKVAVDPKTTDGIKDFRIEDDIKEFEIPRYKPNKKFYAIPSDLINDKNGKLSSFIEENKAKNAPKFFEKLRMNYDNSRRLNAAAVTMDETVKGIDNSFGKEYSSIVENIFDFIKPNGKELELLRSDGDFAVQYIQEKFKDIADDEFRYKELLTRISEAPVIAEAERQRLIDRLVKNATFKLDNISQNFSPEMKTMRDFSDIATSTNSGLVGDLEKYAKEALNGIDATKDRLLLALDFEKRLLDGTLKEQWENTPAVNLKWEDVPQPDGTMKKVAKVIETLDVRQTFEEFVDDSRQIIYKSTMNDFSNTHYIKQNGAYYQRLHNVLFNQPMDSKTTSILDELKSGLSNALEATRVKFMALGSNGVKAASKGAHAADYVCMMNGVNSGIINNDTLRQLFENTLEETDAVKYQMTGKPIKNFIIENAGQKFNARTWMKVFAPMTGALIGITLLSQLFIGKDKDRHLYMTKTVNTGAVDGNK